MENNFRMAMGYKGDYKTQIAIEHLEAFINDFCLNENNVKRCNICPFQNKNRVGGCDLKLGLASFKIFQFCEERRKDKMESRDKFVDFQKYCNMCEYRSKSESEDPCWECLTNPVNTDSHKPVNYKVSDKIKDLGKATK